MTTGPGPHVDDLALDAEIVEHAFEQARVLLERVVEILRDRFLRLGEHGERRHRHSPRGEKANFSCASAAARAGLQRAGGRGDAAAPRRGAAARRPRLGARSVGRRARSGRRRRRCRPNQGARGRRPAASRGGAALARISARRRRAGAARAFAVRRAWITAPSETRPKPGSSSAVLVVEARPRRGRAVLAVLRRRPPACGAAGEAEAGGRGQREDRDRREDRAGRRHAPGRAGKQRRGSRGGRRRRRRRGRSAAASFPAPAGARRAPPPPRRRRDRGPPSGAGRSSRRSVTSRQPQKAGGGERRDAGEAEQLHRDVGGDRARRARADCGPARGRVIEARIGDRPGQQRERRAPATPPSAARPASLGRPPLRQFAHRRGQIVENRECRRTHGRPARSARRVLARRAVMTLGGPS